MKGLNTGNHCHYDNERAKFVSEADRGDVNLRRFVPKQKSNHIYVPLLWECGGNVRSLWMSSVCGETRSRGSRKQIRKIAGDEAALR